MWHQTLTSPAVKWQNSKFQSDPLIPKSTLFLLCHAPSRTVRGQNCSSCPAFSLSWYFTLVLSGSFIFYDTVTLKMWHPLYLLLKAKYSFWIHICPLSISFNFPGYLKTVVAKFCFDYSTLTSLSTSSTVCMFVCAQSLSGIQLFVTPWTVAHQAPLSMGFFRQEYWSGLPHPPGGDLPDPGIKSMSPVATEPPEL